MTVTKNVYVLMLALVIVLSGCIGGTADGQDEGDCGESTDDCTTVIHNHYYNNTTTTTTTVVQESPEMIADKLYDDPQLHWVILLVNDITDRYHQWPMSTPQFQAYVKDKYTNPLSWLLLKVDTARSILLRC